MVCLSEREGEGAGFRLACARTVRPIAFRPKELSVAGGVVPSGPRCGARRRIDDRRQCGAIAGVAS